MSGWETSSRFRQRAPAVWLGAALARYWAFLVLLAAWELWTSNSGLAPLVVPAPLSVLEEMPSVVRHHAGSLLHTLGVAVMGLALGFLVGYLAAVAAWASTLVRGLSTPLAVGFRSIPIVALIPLLNHVFGYGTVSVVAVTSVIAFFPAYVFGSGGLGDVPAHAEDLMAAFGANRWRYLRLVVLPGSLDRLLVGFQIAAASAVLAAVTAEYLAGSEGIGHVLAESQALLKVRETWAVSILVAALSVIAYSLAVRLATWWRRRLD